jgi:serine/threonine-protein kinase
VTARQEDFVFAEHVLRRGFANEGQIQECLQLLERLRGEMELDETLANILLKKGYLAPAQKTVIEQAINPDQAGGAKNQIEGYQLLTRLGSGAMGSVYKAQHLKLDIPVALKVLRVDLAKSRTQIERLKREARLAARLNHPNIVRSLDVGESYGFHYFAMEYVDGATVRQRLHRARLREKDALRIVRDVARALEHAHENGVVHRDVKPANIMLTRDGIVKLADFGLARGKEPSELTLDQSSIGTPQYLAPEQARRGSDATGRSDLFSLGASLYHMVTGRPPFSGENLGEIFQKVLACDFDPPESIVPDLSLDTIYLIHRLMRANPRQRYGSATELLADLERVESGQRIAPSEFKGDYQAYLQRRRIRNFLAGAGAAVVILVAGFFVAQQVKDFRQKRKRLEACRIANEVGGRGLDKIEGLEDLRAARAEMEAARDEADCSTAEISGLLDRLGRVEADILGIEEALRVREEAGRDGADYRALHRRIDGVWRRIDLPGPTLIVERLRRELFERSEEEARERYRALFLTHASAADALKALEAFARDVDERYLALKRDKEFRPHEIAGQVVLLRELMREWEQTEKDYSPTLRANLKAHRYRSATATLDQLILEHERVVQSTREAGLNHREFLRFFDDGERHGALRLAEEAWFKDHVQKRADELRQAHDPDAAERLVREFADEALVTRTRVDALLEMIDAERRQWRTEENAILDSLEERVRRSLRDRQWGSVWARVNEQFGRTEWLPVTRKRLETIHRMAEAYRQLLDRYAANAAGRGERFADGSDPDLFLDAEGNPFTLKGRAREDIADVLALSEDEPRLRGHFLLGEHYVEADPRGTHRLLGTAIEDLNRAGDPIVVRLRQREIELGSELSARERRAEEVHRQLKAASERKDYNTALQLLSLLESKERQGLRRTDYVDQIWTELRREAEALRRRGGVEYLRLQAGLPGRPENWHEDVESDRITIRFDFLEWWPDEGKVADEVKDKRAWEFWRRRFETEGRKESDWRALFERAKHQLLWFNDALVPHERGGAVLAAGLRENHSNWWQRREDAIRVIKLHNPLRTDRDWSIELTVSWERDPDGEDAGYPSYFALTAGQLQAGFVADDVKPMGGFGARIFRQESLFDGLERKDRFYPFHARFVNKDERRRKRFPRGGELNYFEQFKEEQKKPWRLRLERAERVLRFYAAPLQDWERRGGFDPESELFLQKPFRRDELDEACRLEDGQAVFRILSLRRCRLAEVKLEGELRR